jgi:gamma-glutamyl hercynylcysteine S-oxide hydrolase
VCRFVAWIGRPRTLESLLLDPPFGLLRQSYAPRRQKHGTINADGFGVGWYSPLRAQPARYRTALPMWSDESFASLAGVVESGCVLAGVRSASVGMPVETTATAPFTADGYLFGHNGFVPDAAVLRSLLPSGAIPESRVDSALLWTIVRARLAAGSTLAGALGDVVTSVGAATHARMNLFLTDGKRFAATAWGDSLWYRRSDEGVLLASEPDDEANGTASTVDTTATDTTDTTTTTTTTAAAADTTPWIELPDRSLLTIEQGRISTSALDGFHDRRGVTQKGAA